MVNIVANQACPSLNERALENTTTVPLIVKGSLR